MHMVGIRKQLIAEHPWLAVSVFKAFIKAKEIAVHELRDAGVHMVTLPWVYQEVLAAEELIAKDYWSYGVDSNRAAIEAMTRYSFEQGLAQRKLTSEDLFHPGTLEMSKI